MTEKLEEKVFQLIYGYPRRFSQQVVEERIGEEGFQWGHQCRLEFATNVTRAVVGSPSEPVIDLLLIGRKVNARKT